MDNTFTYGGAGTGVALCCALAFGCFFLGAVFLLGRRRIRPLWGAVSALVTTGALVLCAMAPRLGILIAMPAGDPAAEIGGFLDALGAQDWPAAYEKLDTYAHLGLENTPQDPAGAALAEALRESYSYTLTGGCELEDLTARQQADFTYLSLSATEAAAAERLPEVLARIVDQRPRAEVYDDNNNYLPQVAQEAYLTALSETLAEPDGCYATDTLTLTAWFSDGQWHVQPDPALLRALAGGTEVSTLSNGQENRGPVAACLGTVTIYWSSLPVLLGVCAWFSLGLALYTVRGRSALGAWAFLPLACLLSFFFARLFHWYCHAEQYAGLAGAFRDLGRGSYCLPGVILGVALSALLVRAFRLCKSAWALLDAMAPGAALGLGIMRLSALFNSSCRGKGIISDPRFQGLPFGAATTPGSGEYRFATFFVYFLALTVLSVLLLSFAVWRGNSPMKKGPAQGHTALLFLTLYSAVDLVLDSTRYDSSFLRSNGFVSAVQIIGVAAMVGVLVFYTVQAIRANGFRVRQGLYWLLFLCSLGAAGYSEYLIQRHGNWFLGCYGAMSAGCALMALAVFLMYRTVRAVKGKTQEAAA